MRARNIKQGFYKNEDLAECSVAARLIFPGLWMLADCMGRLEYRPKRIKGELLPFDNIDAAPLLDELDNWGLIKIYEVDGKKYIWIPNFLKHQRPHDNETASTIPRHLEDYYDEKVPRSKKTTSTCNQGESNEEPETQALATKEESTCNQGEKHFALNPESGILNQELNTSCPEAQAQPDSNQPEVEDVVVFEMPVKAVKKGEGNVFYIRQSHIDHFTELFPALDVMQELKNIQAWNESKPAGSRKTYRGFIQHVTNWLIRSQNKPRPVMRASPANIQQTQPEQLKLKEFDPRTIYGDDFEYPKTATTKH